MSGTREPSDRGHWDIEVMDSARKPPLPLIIEPEEVLN